MPSVEERGDGRTVQLKNVRISFGESLKDASAAAEDAEPKHGSNFLLEPDVAQSPDNQTKIFGALEAACEKEFRDKGAYKTISDNDPKRVCFRKGERFRNQESGEIYAGYEGTMVLCANGPRGGRQRPKMMDRHKRRVETEDILDVCYNGSYADIIVSFYGTTKGGRGVFASIEAIRSRQEGAPMGGGVQVSEDDFDDLEDEGDSFAGTDAAEDAPAFG